MRIWILAGACVAIATPSLAAGYCSAPSAPSSFYKPDKPRKPALPYCANEYSRTNTCKQYEIDSYNSEIDLYNARLRSYQNDVEEYIGKLKSYLESATKYAKCEVESLDD
jgi:hypothetical protein